MTTETIQIMNLSCKGCVNTISRNIKNIDGVVSVDVNLETANVTVEHDGSVNREDIAKLLHSLGYPEVNNPNSVLTKLKSKKSCIIGRIK